MTPTRFVILHHVLSDGEHWDLMIEQGDALATWQLSANPVERRAPEIAARRIGAHRKAYLEYEGPISGGRGEVCRVAAGTCEVLEAGNERWHMRMQSDVLAGGVELVRCAADEWTLRCELV